MTLKNYRDDDIVGFIQKIERTGTSKPKINQTWHGEAAIVLTPGMTPAEAHADLVAGSNSRWISTLVSGVTSKWALFNISYLAKGANADDCEKKLLSVFDHLAEHEVAIRTKIVIPVGE